LTPFFPLVFILWFVIVITVVSYITGWRRLSECYHTDRPFDGKVLRFQSALMRWGSHYGGCLNAGANTEGLYLSLMFFFRPGHPPLFIPWSDIAVQEESTRMGKSVKLSFAKAPGIPLTITSELADKLKAEAGYGWPEKSVV
jgi:hypothetical protein